METNNNFTTTTDNGKTAAIVSYITLIGWLISYFGMYKENKTALSTYHLRQSLLLHLSMIVLNIALSIVIMIIPTVILVYVSWVLYVAYLVLMILGAVSASNQEQKPLPILGNKAQEVFSSI